MELHGVGVGRAIAIGPILRMPDPLPEPEAVGHSGDAAAELAATQESLTAVAAELDAIGERSGGPARGVLKAAAMMAMDPTLADDVRARPAPDLPARGGPASRLRSPRPMAPA